MRYFRRVRTILVGLAVSLLTAGVLMPSSAAAARPSFGHVFVIVGENKSLFQLTSANAPYITTKLRHHSAWFTNYHDVVKGSLPNYIALTSGQYAPCQKHGPCGKFAVPNVFAQVGTGGWRAWNESMPSNCYGKNAGAASTDYMHLFGLTALGYMWARVVKAVLARQAKGESNPALDAKLTLAKFFGERMLPETGAHLARLTAGAATVMALPAEAF